MISGLAVVLVATAGVVLAAGSRPRHVEQGAFGHAGDDLLPDLVTAPITDVYTDDVAGFRMLRFTHEIDNIGRGPLEIHPLAASCPATDSAGPTYRGQMWIYRDGNADGQFERDQDGQTSRKVVTCLIYHAAHQHWHIDNFVRYDLYRPFDDQPVRTSGKVSFCLVDSVRPRPDLAGSPPGSYFQVLDGTAGDCAEHTLIGLSVGYGDLYHANLVDQWIDVDGLPPGRYCLVTRTDVHNFIPESNETNNDRSTPIALTQTGAHLVRHERCAV